jgi:cyclopropane fatty-acyl-phospholipid synthase-like methyltransferase
MATKLAPEDIAGLDPFKFMAVIGKRVIHPGGRASTDKMLLRAGITAQSRVLDVGCGVGTTAVEIAKRFDADVTAVDIAPLMLERAGANVRAADVADKVSVVPATSATSTTPTPPSTWSSLKR